MSVTYQKETFNCFIQDDFLGDKFSAKVILRKRSPIRPSLQKDGKVELADIFIESISANHGNHHHFVVKTLNGEGLYMVRDPDGNEVHRRECSIWDLGNLFGKLVSQTLQRFA